MARSTKSSKGKMMKTSYVLGVAAAFAASGFLAAGCASSGGAKQTSAATPAWIAESNAIAAEYSHAWAAISPESGSGLGYREYDTKATRIDDELEVRVEKFLVDWKAKLSAKQAAATNAEVKIDIRVLLDNLDQSLESIQLEKKYGDIPFSQVANSVFYSMQSLINEQSPPERKKAAIDRFKAYVHGFKDGDKTARPRSEAAKQQTESKLKLYSKKTGPSKGRVFLPLRAEVETYLRDSGKIVEGLESVLKQSGRDDWKDDYAAFRIQMNTYENWVRTVVLPMARRDHKLPRDLYAMSLKRVGNLSTPEKTREVARKAFVVGLKEYRQVAAQIAKRDGLKDSSPKAVIAHLKKSVEADPVKVHARYVQADRELSADIVKRDLVSLPKTPLRIRVASEAESRIQPVPHLDTPPLFGNTGERPEFVVPVGSADKLAFDDFAFAAAAKSLTAHEGRPGHDLQFSSILDNGVSTIRATYAFNSVNVEGWGLYAEWLMEPSLSLDEKMALLMMRMMRNARMFLDPELHLGLITPEKAKKVITEQVAMTPEWADLELQRYMFKMPGQAPSYYYGYLKLREIREETMKRMGTGFNERCFHDAILEAGLLPLEILAEKMRVLSCESVKIR